MRASAVVAYGFSCPCGLWDLPGPEIKLVAPALAGRFLTTGSPRKSSVNDLGAFFPV